MGLSRLTRCREGSVRKPAPEVNFLLERTESPQNRGGPDFVGLQARTLAVPRRAVPSPVFVTVRLFSLGFGSLAHAEPTCPPARSSAGWSAGGARCAEPLRSRPWRAILGPDARSTPAESTTSFQDGVLATHTGHSFRHSCGWAACVRITSKAPLACELKIRHAQVFPFPP